MLARQPITRVLKSADPDLHQQLLLAQQLRAFAVGSLGLPDNRSYQSFVNLNRDYPVWTVVAAQEFSVQAKTWCYLVIGCASYRGYFSKSAAENYAQKLKSQGFEVVVGGSIAYSTLGWFADPLLPSMFGNRPVEFAENMFHELAHVLYVNGNSVINEAFATVVGEYGAQLWLNRQSQPLASRAYQSRVQHRNDFYQLQKYTKRRLSEIYSRSQSVNEMRNEKQRVFQQFREDYRALVEEKWQGRDYYRHWMALPMNNARLASLSTYRDLLPAMRAVLASCDFVLPRFYALLKQALKDYRPGDALEYSCKSYPTESQS
jgi:predicted aminopeptidase